VPLAEREAALERIQICLEGFLQILEEP
jgi:hypothetical protein